MFVGRNILVEIPKGDLMSSFYLQWGHLYAKYIDANAVTSASCILSLINMMIKVSNLLVLVCLMFMREMKIISHCWFR